MKYLAKTTRDSSNGDKPSLGYRGDLDCHRKIESSARGPGCRQASLPNLAAFPAVQPFSTPSILDIFYKWLIRPRFLNFSESYKAPTSSRNSQVATNHWLPQMVLLVEWLLLVSGVRGALSQRSNRTFDWNLPAAAELIPLRGRFSRSCNSCLDVGDTLNACLIAGRD